VQEVGLSSNDTIYQDLFDASVRGFVGLILFRFIMLGCRLL